MKIIISPAKKMNMDTDSLPWQSLPCFMPRTREILDTLRGMSYDELKKMWKCNDSIARLNYQRLEEMELDKALTPAILSYEGIQYRYMAPNVFTDSELDYIQDHLRILSGFYGLLRPFDGIRPYRLEMQAALSVAGRRDLYGYWGASLAEKLYVEEDCVVNLASKEYSVCISRYSGGRPFISCSFAEEKDGRLIEKGTLCKMARGEMVRFMAERQIQRPEELREFDRLNYRFSAAASDDVRYVFILDKKAAPGKSDMWS